MRVGQTPSLTHDTATPPVRGPVRIATDSNFGDTRSAKSGAATKFHPGVDIIPPADYLNAHGGSAAGFEVIAPHDGWILFSGKLASAPPDVRNWLSGYGPGVVLIAHDDVHDPSFLSSLGPGHSVSDAFQAATGPSAQSAYYTLLAHLDPDSLQPRELDQPVRELENGAPNGSQWRTNIVMPLGAVDHRHDVMTYQPGGDRTLFNDAPGARYVKAGDVVGLMDGSMGHVHWEIRSTPLASGGPQDANGVPLQEQDVDKETKIRVLERLDPFAWLHLYGALPPNIDTAPHPRTDGGGGLLLLGLLLLLADDEKKGRRRRSGW